MMQAGITPVLLRKDALLRELKHMNNEVSGWF